MIKTDYVNNEKLEIALRNWINDCQICICLDRKRPKITEFIGDCILKIIVGLSSRYNFSKYTYKEEMVGDAIVHVCTYLNGFNATKGTAFNFISFAAYNSFSARIKQEHRQTYYKNKNLQKLANETGVMDINGKFNDPGLAHLINDSHSSDFSEKVATYEAKYKPEKKEPTAKKLKGLFAFAEENTNDKGEI